MKKKDKYIYMREFMEEIVFTKETVAFIAALMIIVYAVFNLVG